MATVGEDLPVALNLRPHLAALASNDTLVILADGRGAQSTVKLPVTRMSAHFSPGAVSLARVSGAPVLPTFVVDEPRPGDPIGMRLVIHPPLDLQVTADAAADNRANLERFAAVYGRQVRTHPHNWQWMWLRDGEIDHERASR